MPALRALAAQLLGACIVVALLRIDILFGYPPIALAALQGAFAATIAATTRARSWWLVIHFFFMPAVLMASQLGLPSWMWALGFGGLALVYWTTFRTQVPLFLSSIKTVATLADALPAGPLRVLDVGSGTGRFVRHFARMRPETQVDGVEAAPGPAWLARWQTRKQANARLMRGDFFALDWSAYDVVYAFLSPAPMQEVWDKARREMRAGAVLISNSFPVPEHEPDGVLEVDDRRKTQLYCYTLGADKNACEAPPRIVWPWPRPRATAERGAHRITR